ncbi:hypothetical protein AM571_PC00394 (plasmid) [Rhizobium etli 8C-3]|uniref:Uncharacterized protein n=1 Tax=Rhizobium etli 8C-3 TaxID=538025 RepID=A0A1L5PDB9_RHIET|nr:hypothetical protein AM571_PC00394 [Rhizobium etli 8C-3]
MLALVLYRNSCRVYLLLPVPPAVPLWRFTPSHLMGRNYLRPIFSTVKLHDRQAVYCGVVVFAMPETARARSAR